MLKTEQCSPCRRETSQTAMNPGLLNSLTLLPLETQHEKRRGAAGFRDLYLNFSGSICHPAGASESEFEIIAIEDSR
jgi:hypothetical protein